MPGTTSKRYPAELRERVVPAVGEILPDHESEWAAMTQVATLLGVGTPETVRKWCRTRKGDKYVTVIIDLTGIGDGTCPSSTRFMW
jgi:transposase